MLCRQIFQMRLITLAAEPCGEKLICSPPFLPAYPAAVIVLPEHYSQCKAKPLSFADFGFFAPSPAQENILFVPAANFPFPFTSPFLPHFCRDCRPRFRRYQFVFFVPVCNFSGHFCCLFASFPPSLRTADFTVILFSFYVCCAFVKLCTFTLSAFCFYARQSANTLFYKGSVTYAFLPFHYLGINQASLLYISRLLRHCLFSFFMSRLFFPLSNI